jgi:hypothetical protein
LSQGTGKRATRARAPRWRGPQPEHRDGNRGDLIAHITLDISYVVVTVFVWGSTRVATPPEINVLGTLIFIVAVGGMLANVLLQTGRAKAG